MGVFGKWLDYKATALMNGSSAFIKEIPESSLAPFVMWGHRTKMAIYEPESGLSPDTESAGDSQSLELWDINCCLIHPIYSTSVIAAQTDWDSISTLCAIIHLFKSLWSLLKNHIFRKQATWTIIIYALPKNIFTKMRTQAFL